MRYIPILFGLTALIFSLFAGKMTGLVVSESCCTNGIDCLEINKCSDIPYLETPTQITSFQDTITSALALSFLFLGLLIAHYRIKHHHNT